MTNGLAYLLSQRRYSTQASQWAMPTVLNSSLNPAPYEWHTVLESKLNHAAAEFYRHLRHCHGEHVDGDDMCEQVPDSVD